MELIRGRSTEDKRSIYNNSSKNKSEVSLTSKPKIAGKILKHLYIAEMKSNPKHMLRPKPERCEYAYYSALIAKNKSQMK